MATTIELYTMLKDKIGDAETKALVEAIEETPRKAKEELLKDFATKADLLLLEERMKSEFKNVRLEMKLYFLILAFLIILANPRAIDLISKILGIVK
ncbi:MAG: hypothetical protein HQK88_04745 [Nitrospirae bacterium]|nr:hypothetical protein [Nitrospirota bacterium]MBF0533953.1 hypothetical protein [Nitrospirota bacterium]MBF0616112.1 hypothetical protein [Nitrospirota bacterium]